MKGLLLRRAQPVLQNYSYNGGHGKDAFQVVLVVKNPPASGGDIRDESSIPGLGRSPGERNGKSLQYSGLENTTDRGAWRAKVHGVTKSQTWLKQLST